MPRELTPREIADKLASKFHEYMVGASAGGAEETRAAYAITALSLRELAGSRYRVTRHKVYIVARWCRNEATGARVHGKEEYAQTMEICADTIQLHI